MRTASSSLVPNQLPAFVRDDYPTFVAFVEAYYEYLDGQGVDLKSLRDLDNTLDQFIQYFKKELAVNLPSGLKVDERFLLEHLKDQYLAKGSEGSFKLLFRLLYNKNVAVNYPGTQMLRASDGRWQQDISMFVKVSLGTPDLIDGKLVDVIKPNRVIRILIDRRQYVEVEVNRVVALSDNTYELFIDRKYFGDISVGDVIRYKEIFAGTVVATTSALEIVERGTGFKQGQLFELKNGSGVRSIIKVTRTNVDGGILSAEFIKFGIGYGTDFTVSINSTNDYRTSTDDALLSTVTIVPGGVSVKESTRGFAEQGYINYVDYTSTNYWDGTFAGATIREFAAEPLAGVQVSTEGAGIVKVKLGSLAKYPGYYSANNGFLSDAVFIQDSRYYQAFAYVLKIDERLATYKSAVKTMVHPSGTALFGEFEIQNNFDITVALESLVKTLGLSLKDTVGTANDYATLFTTKVIQDSTTMSEVISRIHTIKALADTLSSPTDAITNLHTGKALASTLSTPTESITAKAVGKALGSQPLNGGGTESTNVTPADSISAINLSKPLSDSVTPSETYRIAMSKPLADTLSTPSDVATILTSKPLSDTLSTPSDVVTLASGKALTDSVTPSETYRIAMSKPLADTLAQQTEVTTILTNKYLSDSTIGTLSNSGYVAKNPYSQGNYFEVTPIIYDNTVDSTFTA